jgi:SAM-dependent methyltransferase
MRFFDIRRILASPRSYSLLQQLAGSERKKRRFVEEILQVRAGDRVLDIGCGPADILALFPPVEYYGFDASEHYIEAAKARFGDRGTFIVGTVASGRAEPPAEYFNLAIATGVVHHLDDKEAESLFATAHAALRPGGRLITIDPCFVAGQSVVARLLIASDRGGYVRSPAAYKALAARVFASVSGKVFDDLARVPYTHFVLECQRDPTPSNGTTI